MCVCVCVCVFVCVHVRVCIPIPMFTLSLHLLSTGYYCAIFSYSDYTDTHRHTHTHPVQDVLCVLAYGACAVMPSHGPTRMLISLLDACT